MQTDVLTQEMTTESIAYGGLDPRVVPARAVEQRPPSSDGRVPCAFCAMLFSPEPEQEILLCGPLCERMVRAQLRRLEGLCPWCEQERPDGPHVVRAQFKQGWITLERDISCVPGLAGQSGRMYTQARKGLIEQCRCGQKGDRAHKPWCRNKFVEEADWRCQLCGGEIDPLLSPRHPMSLSFDHIIEAAKGGPRSNNLQATHSRCNMKRSLYMTLSTARFIWALGDFCKSGRSITQVSDALGTDRETTLKIVEDAMTELAPGAIVKWRDHVRFKGIVMSRRLRGGATYALRGAKRPNRDGETRACAVSA